MSSLRAKKIFPWGRVHFIGIGGAGMSQIAHLLVLDGISVSGSDLSFNKRLVPLYSLGVQIFLGSHCADNLQDSELVVFSSAIQKDNLELREAREKGIIAWKRGDFLALLSGFFSYVVCVIGSHGKSTISTMIVHLCRLHGYDISYCIGATPKGGDFPASSLGESSVFIIEVDESDGTMNSFQADLAIFASLEDDHQWNFNSSLELRNNFQKFLFRSCGVICPDSEVHRCLLSKHKRVNFIDKSSYKVDLPQKGIYQQENALLALASFSYVYPECFIKNRSFKGFLGLERRANLYFSDAYLSLWEDYAHHPTEIEAFFESISGEKGKKVVIFEAHRFQRLKQYFQEFFHSLSKFDFVFILPTFSAWVDDEQSSVTKDFFDKFPSSKAVLITQKTHFERGKAIYDYLKKDLLGSPLNLIALGAGNIEKDIVPLKHFLALYLLKKKIPKLKFFYDKTFADISYSSVGDAPLIIVSPNPEKLPEVVSFFKKQGLEYFILGNGSNLIGTDDYVDKIFIKLDNGFEDIEIQEDLTVWVGAGIKIRHLINNLLPLGLGGLEEFCGIPANIGGAVKMNAGAHDKEFADILLKIEGISIDGIKKRIDKSEIKFAYRQSKFSRGFIITRVLLKVEKKNRELINRQLSLYLNSRKEKQPYGRSCGCVFKNPKGDFAGRLISRWNPKLTKKENCYLSSLHHNFILTEKKTKARDYLDLICEIRLGVYKKSGIILELEGTFINQKDYFTILFSIQPKTILVLKGGISLEREISLKSGDAVAEALQWAGHRVIQYDIQEKAFPSFEEKIDLVFPLLHGEFGEDGEIHRLIEKEGLSYIGSIPDVHHLCINKKAMINFVSRYDEITTAPSELIVDLEEKKIKAPFIVKLNKQGSSFALSFVENEKNFAEAFHKAKACEEEILIEKFIEGIEFTISYFKGEILPLVEIRFQGKVFSFEKKYCQGNEVEFILENTSIPKEIEEKAHQFIFKLINDLSGGLKDIFRVDFIYSPQEGKIYFLEINTIPGFTSTSLLPLAGKKKSYSFLELCACLINQK